MGRLGLPSPWAAAAPDDRALFSRHLGLDSPRPLQVGLVDLARALTEPELLILEAPTGEGKTKAALGAAEILASRFGLGGVLFALPTQATSDGIFGVVRDWLGSIETTADVSLSLAHGKAAFNTDFQQVPKTAAIFDTDTSGTEGRAVAHWFLTGRGKLATMSDFVVGTVDQLLMAALCAKHVVLRHLGVTGKVVVIDEIHAADVFMRQYLCRMLTWLAAYDVPVIAMSATLTPSIRHELLAAYNDGRGRRTPRAGTGGTAYPRITHTAPDGAAVVALPASARSSTIRRSELAGGTDDIAAAALAAARRGGNVAVICNTVRRAQDVFRAIGETADDVELELLHSRFLTPERIDKEQRLRARLGPSAQHTDGQRPLVVVATQVIEQSLDIDFDVMFSDIAPVDLLLQRAGRLHRHEWKHETRPPAHRTATLIFTGFERTEGEPPRLDRGCTAVYGAAALLRAIATLDEHFGNHDTIVSPDHVADLVTRAYETIGPPAGWEDAWARAQEKDDDLRHEKRRRAKGFLIPSPARRDLVGWADQSAADAVDERAVAQVRDAEDSIEVVVIQRINGCPIIPEWAAEHAGAQLDFATVIDDDIAVAAAKNTLRLPGYLSSAGIGDLLIDDLEQNCIDTWQNSRWLKGVLPLVLDANGDAEHVGHLFHYDTDLGLVVTRSENS